MTKNTKGFGSCGADTGKLREGKIVRKCVKRHWNKQTEKRSSWLHKIIKFRSYKADHTLIHQIARGSKKNMFVQLVEVKDAWHKNIKKCLCSFKKGRDAIHDSVDGVGMRNTPVENMQITNYVANILRQCTQLCKTVPVIAIVVPISSKNW